MLIIIICIFYFSFVCFDILGASWVINPRKERTLYPLTISILPFYNIRMITVIILVLIIL